MIRLCFVMAIASVTVSGCGVFVGGPWGVWTDPVTGYTWQEQPANNTMRWQQATDYCNDLTLDGHDDWRLPTISELRTLIRGCSATETGGSCGVTDTCLSYPSCQDDSCGGCTTGGGPADGCYWPQGMQGSCGWFWSSSDAGDSSPAWGVNFSVGLVGSVDKGNSHDVRCVRRGP